MSVAPQDAIVGLRARGLHVSVDSVLMPSDQNDLTAAMLRLRGQMNMELRYTKIGVMPTDTEDGVAAWLVAQGQEKLVEFYRGAQRL